MRLFQLNVSGLILCCLLEEKPTHAAMSSRDAALALASHHRSRAAAFARPFRLPPTVLAARQAATQPSAPSPATKRVSFAPMQKEIKWLMDKVESKSYNMPEGFQGYGSTDGAWRRAAGIGGQVKLPSGCAPRRSRRLGATG